MIRSIDEIKKDKTIKNNPVIKKLNKMLSGEYGDILRLCPNETASLVFVQIAEYPEWKDNPMEFSKYIYERLWTDARVERKLVDRCVY